MSETWRLRVAGLSAPSSIVMRLSGRTWNTSPLKKRISAAAPDPVRTRSSLLNVMLGSAFTQTSVPARLTCTLPSSEAKRAVVTATGVVSGGGGGEYFL
jgi:hypothetical protein